MSTPKWWNQPPSWFSAGTSHRGTWQFSGPAHLVIWTKDLKDKHFLETFQLLLSSIIFIVILWNAIQPSFNFSHLSRFNGHKLVHLDLKGAPPKMEYLIKVHYNVYYCLTNLWFYKFWGTACMRTIDKWCIFTDRVIYRFLCAYTLRWILRHLKVSTN